MEWQPIETAKIGDEIIIGWIENGKILEVSKTSKWSDYGWKLGYMPTHWMLLPDPPKSA